MPALGRIIGALLIYLLALSAVSAGNTAPLAARPSPTHPPTSAPAVSSQQHTNLTNTSAHYRHRASRYYCPLALHGPTPPHSAPCPTPTRLTQPPLCPRANTSQTTPGNTFYIIVRQHNSSTPYPPTPPTSIRARTDHCASRTFVHVCTRRPRGPTSLPSSLLTPLQSICSDSAHFCIGPSSLWLLLAH